MGLTRKDESIVVRLSSGIEEAKENKNKILGYVNGLKEKCENREITYSEYEQLLNKKRDGKTIKQWLGVYDSYIKDCGSKIENEEMRSAGKKILAVFLFFLFISLVSVILFYFRGSIIGLVVQEQTQEYTEQLNLTFSSSASHEWQIQNFGQLNSVKLSGLIEGEGEVKVYLDDYLILDSSNIKTKQAGLTGLAVDEAAPEPSSSPAPESSPAPSAETPSESPQASSTESTPAEAPSEPASSTPSETQPSYSEEQGAQSPKQSETAPSQPQNEPPSSSEQSEEPAVPEIPPEETASEENVTEVQPQENITGITPKENTTETNVTQPTAPSGETGVEKPKEKQIRRFNRICEETCDLSSLNLNKSSYSLRIEINNASVSLEEIIYEILIEKQALNETIESNESVINLTDANVTLINTTSSGIVIGQPVKWTKRVELDKPGKIKVKLPKEAENISVNKIKSYSEPISSEQSEEPAVFSITSSITGQVIEENKPGFFTRLFSSLTGRAVTTEESSQSKDLVIEDNASEYEITYETPAPEATEINISENQKQIIISAPDLGYENVLAFTNLSKEVPINQIALYHETENNQRVQLKAYDNNRNGLIDYVEWIVPHLSNQSYMLVIEITKAEHLDASRNFISDIYEEVKAIDGIWSEAVGEGEYVRLTFEENLTKYSDIKIYARGVNSRIEVYAKDSNELITTFENINEEGWYRVYLNNLGDKSYNSFDLKILGSVEFDYVIDPNLNLEIIGSIDTYTASVFLKTNPDSTSGFDAYDIESNPPPSDYAEFYSNITYAGTEYHLAVDSWNASENPRTLYLIYYIDSAQTGSLNFSWASLEGSEYYMNFTYYGTDSTYTTPIASRDMRTNTGYNASITSASYLYVKIGYSEDTTAPNIVVKSPTNTTYNTSTVTFNVSSNENLSFCKFTINNWEYNYTMTRKNDTYFNFTNTSIADGSYIAKYWCNDTANNTNSSQTIAFAVDTIYPLINLTYPMNITYNYVTHSLNYTYAEVGCDSVWYSLNLGVTNSSRQNCGLNWSGLTASEGSNTWMVYINDTVNHLNSSRRTFTVDTTPPNINISSPANTTYAVSWINFNISSNENLSFCKFTINNWEYNYTMTRKNDTYFNFTNSSMKDGSYTAKYWCNDTMNNINNSEKVTFIISTNNPPSNPTVTINSTDGSNKTLQDLWCRATISDPDSNLLNVSVEWYKENSYQFRLDYNNSYTSGTLFNASLHNANTTKGDNWSCGIRLHDGADYSNWVNSSKLRILNTAPEIIRVYNQSMAVTINEGPDPSFAEINFTAYDPDSASDLSDATSYANLSFPSEDLRNVSVCQKKQSSGDYANYTCNITMWWWDVNDTWTANVYIKDTEGTPALNSTVQAVGEQLSIINGSASLIAWPGLMPGTINQTASSSLLINNIGNIPLTNLPINATNLRGETDDTKYLWAANFSAGTETGPLKPECAGTSMRHGLFTQIESSVLPRGNYTKNDGTAQEELYFCLRVVGSDLTQVQAYSTSKEGAWAVDILQLALLTIVGRRKKKNKLKEKTINSPLITRRLREEKIPISIFKKQLGGLEAVVKYLKENLQLTYHEIAELLNRNERTIWTAYNKSKDKMPEKFETEKTDILVPLRIFSTEQTALEAVIAYLKEKQLKNKQIAELLNRDERNIWTIYNLAKSKIKKAGKQEIKPEIELEEIKDKITIPISIFTKQLGGLETVVKYMKENLQLTYHEIAELLNRNERTIWTAYNKSKDKMPEKLEIRKGLMLPLRIFSTKLTALKAAISYLKEKQMQYVEIAELLNRDERNIWTIYNRTIKHAFP